MRMKWLVLMMVGALGCSETPSAKSVRAPRPDEIPTSVGVAGGKLVAGFKDGKVRSEKALEPFRITKHPVTVAQYKACIAAGACTIPESNLAACEAPQHDAFGATFGGAGALPMTCVRPAQAEVYCKWVGGALPTSDQWMLAARGQNPQRHAWGDDAPSCAQHPFATREGQSCVREGTLEIGNHPKARSVAGLEDVLSTPSELLRGDESSAFGACSARLGGCVVTGTSPGEIGSFARALPGAEQEREAPFTKIYGFRCAWNEVSQ
jgi:formylglycine-generating enzyme required for sulfatase activity